MGLALVALTACTTGAAAQTGGAAASVSGSVKSMETLDSEREKQAFWEYSLTIKSGL